MLIVYDRAILRFKKVVVEVLLNSGADVDVPDSSGQTCLHTACKVDDDEIARLVLEKSRNITAKDNKCVR